MDNRSTAKRCFLAMTTLALTMALTSNPAQARTTTPPPIPSVEVVVFCQTWGEPYGTLLTAKAHPSHVVAVGLSCEDVTRVSKGQFYRQACEIIAATYGRWVVNKAWKGDGGQMIWEPLRCADVLVPAVPHGALLTI